jgi:glycosyltransferase involved in cell wall biosynthesis
MRITWVTRSFLDYRIPVYQEIDRLCGNKLTVIYYKDVVPLRCQEKLHRIIGDRAIGLTGEFRLIGNKNQAVSSATKNIIRIPFQRGLISTIKKTNPDIMIGDGLFQWTYSVLWLRFWKKIPLVVCYEGTKHTERNIKYIQHIYRKIVVRWINKICCNGTQSAEYISSLGYLKENIRLGNMAADTVSLQENIAAFSNEDKIQLKKTLKLNEKVFLFVGRLVSLKGIDKLINVWIETMADNTEVSLLIVGDGPEKEYLEKLCSQSGCKNVIFTGEIDYDFVFQYFYISDIFVIPTLQDNWSLVVPEAMSCGLPIICSKYNGCWPELVKPENGWVFDPLHAENFIQTLQTAWDNRENWKKMGTDSIRIVSDYSPEKVAGRVYSACNSIYNSFIDSRNKL